MLHPVINVIWAGIPVMSIKFLKNRKLPTFSTTQNSVMMSLWGNIKTRSYLLRTGNITLNISYYLNSFQRSFKILDHTYCISYLSQYTSQMQLIFAICGKSWSIMHRILSRYFYRCHTSILSVRGGGSNQNSHEKFHLPSNHIEGNLLKK